MLSALLIGVRDTLRAKLALSEKQCIIRVDVHYVPTAPDRFVVVSPSNWSPGDTRPEIMMGIDEVFGVVVQVCIRSRKYAFEDLPDMVYMERTAGLELMARRVIRAIHQQYEPIKRANEVLNTWGNSQYPFIEPLRWMGTDAMPALIGANAMFAETVDDGLREAMMAVGVSFGGARRITPLNAEEIDLL